MFGQTTSTWSAIFPFLYMPCLHSSRPLVGLSRLTTKVGNVLAGGILSCRRVPDKKLLVVWTWATIPAAMSHHDLEVFSLALGRYRDQS